ncbi:hypothetical protein [Xanthomonas floridensis]|uniref:Lipoprotein n=1 Tax=Xanthomonas floridensis TaxID=1843580 RepID=A0ABU5Q0G2_9XANT|nr:hypothetical protein [Xanthomonas floridensis]MEA5124974.1 hypothetical protein [Xanthomonas floridensis]MEA5132478.1 hypothetical protein [Xanthomonas floridensis]
MTVMSRAFFAVIAVIGVISLCGCNSTKSNIRVGVVLDEMRCKPNSKIHSEIAEAQSACHQAVNGDGIQLIVSKTSRSPSLHSDTVARELTSIFIQPASAVSHVGPVKFEAFYSQGLFDLLGKTGCVGVLESGFVEIKKPSKKFIINYFLRFGLVSPLGWPEDCKESREISGSTEI